jgi:hypothetical protein
MLVGLAYFPHLRDAEDARMLQELEWRRIANERQPRVTPWSARLAARLGEHRRRAARSADTIPGAVPGLPECAAE